MKQLPPQPPLKMGDFYDPEHPTPESVILASYYFRLHILHLWHFGFVMVGRFVWPRC